MFIENLPGIRGLYRLLLIMPLLFSCSHHYDSDLLDLTFYQWNLWPDEQAAWSEFSQVDPSRELSRLPVHPPSCGWEVLHRGNGKLVRIPSTIKDYAGVSWYHCRFSLPEIWDQKRIVLKFEGAGPRVEVYLNQQLIGYHQGIDTPFDVDITEIVYYTLDNHLAIRITDPIGGEGVTGNISVKSSEKLQ